MFVCVESLVTLNGLCILHLWYMTLAVYMAMHLYITLIPSWGPNEPVLELGIWAMPPVAAYILSPGGLPSLSVEHCPDL